jgi:hypothetical protein
MPAIRSKSPIALLAALAACTGRVAAEGGQSERRMESTSGLGSSQASTSRSSTSSRASSSATTAAPGPRDASAPSLDAAIATDAAVTLDAGSAQDVSNDADTATNDAATNDAATNDADVGDAVAACVTTITSLGGTTSNAKILFAFDDASDAGVDPAFSFYSDTGSTAGNPPVLNGADGQPCAGSLTTTVTYTVFGPKTQLYYNYGAADAQDWTGYSTLHFWVKVVTTDPTTIAGVEPRVDSSTTYAQFYGNFVFGTTLSDGGWHEATIDLPAADAGTQYTPSAVVGFQVELQTAFASADGGATAPPDATFLIDSIWLD